MTVKFICGCTTEIVPEFRDEYPTDLEGFLICRDHGLRRYGWRSLPVLANNRPNYSLARYIPLEIEHIVLYGDQYLEAHLKLVAGKDRRDTRDPEIVGLQYLEKHKEFLARRNGVE